MRGLLPEVHGVVEGWGSVILVACRCCETRCFAGPVSARWCSECGHIRNGHDFTARVVLDAVDAFLGFPDVDLLPMRKAS